MRYTRRFVLATALVFGLASPALADATAFIGVSTQPEARRTLGLAVGSGLVVVGFEFEYSQTEEDLDAAAPGSRTVMGNLLVQTPVPVNGIQFYGTVGGGIAREKFEAIDDADWHLGTNLGGGVKITLAGPLRLRLDYRVFVFGGDSTTADKPQRFYAGLNLAF